MIILEYKLDAGEGGMRCPPWVDDGGYWSNTDFTMVGVTRDNPEFHIPSTVVRLTADELETRQVAIHTANPMMKEGAEPGDADVEMTEAEVRTMIQDWVTSKS
tara:strand:+ start:356 stop:664 length:309 start_codon:yes stop_codon:yes gene_type:complete